MARRLAGSWNYRVFQVTGTGTASYRVFQLTVEAAGRHGAWSSLVQG